MLASRGSMPNSAPSSIARRNMAYKYAFSATFGMTLIVCPMSASAQPVTGADTPELSGIDTVIDTWMSTYGVPGVTVAIVRDKKLVYEKGFGWQDLGGTQEIYPDARMRLATNSVKITKRALQQLVVDHALDPTKGLDPTWTVTSVLSAFAPVSPNVYADSMRMNAITIQDLIDDKSCLIDGLNSVQNIGATLGLGRNATLPESIRWAWSQASTMRPSCTVGSTYSYSHYAMEIAGQIIAQHGYSLSGSGYCDPNSITAVTCAGLWYGVYVGNRVAVPMGVQLIQAQNAMSSAYPQEVEYLSTGTTWPQWNRNWGPPWGSPASPTGTVDNAYNIDYFARPGSGTMVSSARDLARFETIYRRDNGAPTPESLNGSFSLGIYAGSLPGTHTKVIDMMTNTSTLGKHHVKIVVLANKEVDESISPPPPLVTYPLVSNLQTVVNNTTTWPTTDLFVDYRIRNYWSSQYMQLGSGVVNYASYNASASSQRWRLRPDAGGYQRIVNAGDSSGMVANEDNLGWAQYLEPHTSWWSEQWTLQNTGTANTKRINARWWSPKRLHVENQLGYVEQSSVPDNYWSGWWAFEPVPSGPTTCSTSATAPNCLCRIGTTPCSCGTPGCPAYWDVATCSQSKYNANDGCDCNCGGWDPDCDLPGAVTCHGSPSGTTCDRQTLQCQ